MGVDGWSSRAGNLLWGQTVIGERADTYNAGATQGTIQINFNAYSDPDDIAIYYPP